MAQVVFNKTSGAATTNNSGDSVTGFFDTDSTTGVIIHNHSSAVIKGTVSSTGTSVFTLLDGHDVVEVDDKTFDITLQPLGTITFSSVNGGLTDGVLSLTNFAVQHTLVGIQGHNFVSINKYAG
ncbi:MAG: hypothetical protein K0U78_05060 [Actinomycetia bacterium]|nr:hypothetical protein [Actinomycetes bacterium]